MSHALRESSQHDRRRVVLLTRAAHGLITAAFLTCIAVVYVGAWNRDAGVVTLVAVAALCTEGALVALSGGHCPLGPLLRQLGDETPFFELLLPRRAALLAVPALAATTVVGIVLLAVRTLGS